MEVVFQSVHRNLVIPFVRNEGRNEDGKYLVKRPIKFKDARAVFDDENDEHKPLIKRLREAQGNVANDGDSFWELNQEEYSAIRINEGNVYARVPADGITEADIKALQYMSALPKSLPPAAKKKLAEMATDIYVRFGVVGMPKPNEDLNPKRLIARVTEMVYALEDMGIWRPDGDSEGETDLGQGEGQDQ